MKIRVFEDFKEEMQDCDEDLKLQFEEEYETCNDLFQSIIILLS